MVSKVKGLRIDTLYQLGHASGLLCVSFLSIEYTTWIAVVGDTFWDGSLVGYERLVLMHTSYKFIVSILHIIIMCLRLETTTTTTKKTRERCPRFSTLWLRNLFLRFITRQHTVIYTTQLTNTYSFTLGNYALIANPESTRLLYHYLIQVQPKRNSHWPIDPYL